MQVEQKNHETITEMSTSERFVRAFGPLGGGLLLDFADLATFGSIGFYLGPIIGGLMGWWLASVYRFGLLGQCVLIVITAAYCTLPSTALVPLATIVFALVKFADRKRVSSSN